MVDLAQNTPTLLTKTPFNFGAFGDGITDDTNALQAAFNWAVNNGAKLELGNFHYAITSPLQLGGASGLSSFGDAYGSNFVIEGDYYNGSGGTGGCQITLAGTNTPATCTNASIIAGTTGSGTTSGTSFTVAAGTYAVGSMLTGEGIPPGTFISSFSSGSGSAGSVAVLTNAVTTGYSGITVWGSAVLTGSSFSTGSQFQLGHQVSSPVTAIATIGTGAGLGKTLTLTSVIGTLASGMNIFGANVILNAQIASGTVIGTVASPGFGSVTLNQGLSPLVSSTPITAYGIPPGTFITGVNNFGGTMYYSLSYKAGIVALSTVTISGYGWGYAVALNPGAYRSYTLRNMTIQASTAASNDNYASGAGIYFNGTYFSQPVFENIEVVNCRSVISVNTNTATGLSSANGELAVFRKVRGHGFQKYLDMKNGTGQALAWAFEDCAGYYPTSYSQGSPEYVHFDIGDSSGGYGALVSNYSSTVVQPRAIITASITGTGPYTLAVTATSGYIALGQQIFNAAGTICYGIITSVPGGGGTGNYGISASGTLVSTAGLCAATPANLLYPAVLYRDNGVSSPVTFIGGRNEGLTTIIDGRSLIPSGSASMKGIDFSVIAPSSVNPLVLTNAASTRNYSYVIEDCLGAVEQFASNISGYGTLGETYITVNDSAKIDILNFTFGTTGFNVAISQYGEASLKECLQYGVSSSDIHVINQTYKSELYSSPLDAFKNGFDTQTGVPANLIQVSNFGAITPSSPWVSSGVLSAWSTSPDVFSSSPYAVNMKIAAGWSAFQNLAPVTAINQSVYYQAAIVAGLGSDGLTISLIDTSVQVFAGLADTGGVSSATLNIESTTWGALSIGSVISGSSVTGLGTYNKLTGAGTVTISPALTLSSATAIAANGAVCDSVTLLDGTYNSIPKISLKATSRGASGNFVLMWSTPATNSSAGFHAYLAWQYASTSPQGGFVHNAGAGQSKFAHGWGSQDSLRVTGRLSLPAGLQTSNTLQVMPNNDSDMAISLNNQLVYNSGIDSNGMLRSNILPNSSVAANATTAVFNTSTGNSSSSIVAAPISGNASTVSGFVFTNAGTGGSGTFALGMVLTGSGITAGSTIIGGSGSVWILDRQSSITGATITGQATLSVSGAGGAAWIIGMQVNNGSTTAYGTISSTGAQWPGTLTGTGGSGTYYLNNGVAVTATALYGAAYYPVGWIIWNNTAAAGGTLLWVCTTAGYASTVPTAAVFSPLSLASAGTLPFLLSQSSVAVGIAPNSTIGANGALMIGTAVGGGTMTLSSLTAGSGITATASVAAFGGTSALDTGKVITFNDGGTYKTFTITGNSGSSTTVVQGTLNTTLSTVGPWANTTWTVGFPIPFSSAWLAATPGLYLYYPANAINSGSVAGLYWTVMSSTTVGVIYNNTYVPNTTSVDPVAPGSPTAFSGTTGVAYTQTTGTNIPLRANPLPGNSLSINGFIEVEPIFLATAPGTAGTKTPTVSFNAQAIFTTSLTTAEVCQTEIIYRNAGSLTAQIGNYANSLSPFGTSTSGAIFGAYNTVSQVTIYHYGQIAVATDWLVLAASLIRATP